MDEHQMTQEDIIRMAREAFLPYDYETRLPLYIPQLGRFAALVAAAEREACAEVAEQARFGGRFSEVAAAIRARGTHEH